MSTYLKDSNNWIRVSKIYVKADNTWTQYTMVQFSGFTSGKTFSYGGFVDNDHTLSIIGVSEISGEIYTLAVLYDGRVIPNTACTWSIESGATYATIDSAGTITILSSADDSDITVRAMHDGITYDKDITITYHTGTTAETTTEIVTDESGNTTATTTTVTNNEDGSSTVEIGQVVLDENDNVIEYSEGTRNNGADGSYDSTITVYDSEGDPIETTNASGDTDGNVNTQEVNYDENGNPVVTAYTIDTSENPDGAKTYNGDGVNTEYYAFDVTRGFICDIHFTVDCSDVPAGQDENHHNILTAKRSSPSPWYGFQLRQSSTNKYIQLGTQFSSGSNVNTRIDPLSITGNVAEYNLEITYDPTRASNSFICKNRATGEIIYRSNGKFPDLQELEYIKVTLGYALDSNENPFRYSDIDVMEFSLRRLPVTLYPPTIDCANNAITLSCSTVESKIYYRLNETGSYLLYSDPIVISADTIVEAYSMVDGDRSETVSANCQYDSGVVEPVITCDGVEVFISCDTPGADIYYRVNETGNFEQYTVSFPITADTIVEAYSVLDAVSSQTVSAMCIYNPEHDYSTDYFTFEIISAGTVAWNLAGAGNPKVIQYSINGGEWTSITSSTSTTISVSAGDKVRFKGSNSAYATSNADYAGFSGGTALFNVEGNIMSLVYGDNFIGNTALTGSYNFCSILKQTNVISAENLILPAMTLTPHCYRALIANSPSLIAAPELPATTLAQCCYRYMFQEASFTTAPDLLAETLVTGCYEGMFNVCPNLNYIKCMATDISAVSSTTAWTRGVASAGTFVKDANTVWPIGNDGIPQRWVVVDEGLKKPSVSCDGLEITLTCGTPGATIYYRLNETGSYAQYTAPISISADTVIETYSELSGDTSDIVKETCIYDDGIEEPVIYCDGEYVTISCETGGADIYYRMGQTGSYTIYDSAIVISADTVCESYAEINGRQSEIVSAECIYDESLKAPVIECDGTAVTIACHTVGADIYYRLNEEGIYVLYESAITITADTVVQAYSEYSGETSEIVREYCVYDPSHDYSKDYLTFRVLSNGTLSWKAIGTGHTDVIQYSINDGAWTPITASTGGTLIQVSAGDVVRFKGTNTTYAKDKSNYAGFEGGTASFNVEGNIMSLLYGDNFENNTALTNSTYQFCSLFKLSNVVSAENLVLPATTLKNYCYRAMFSNAYNLTVAPQLPATTLAQGCYWYMFENCAITEAPDLPAETLVRECYGYMFTGCRSLNYIRCLAITGFSATSALTNWTNNVASNGTFVKADGVTSWTRGTSGIPTSWTVIEDSALTVKKPVIECDGENVTITCETSGASIYYRMTPITRSSTYELYVSAVTISANTTFEAFAVADGNSSLTVTQYCEYISSIPYEEANRTLGTWVYNNQTVETPYSVNRIDGHSASYAKGTFNFETTFALRTPQPTYLWFQHADQSASVYIDNALVEKHWGGYNAFFVDVTNFVHSGTNHVKVALKNNEGNYLAPAGGDFNFNATLGNVKLYTSPVIPAMEYGYDGFHVVSDVATSSATITVKTKIPTGATVTCEIDDGTYHFGASADSTGNEMIFSATVVNPHLWNGTLDPHLYDITLEVYHNGDLYHRYTRPYGLRFFEYVINQSGITEDPYTGFLLNGSPYLLRGVCMHDDIEGKANALTDADYAQTFSIIQELNCNFLRLAHYPHPKETYDWCDRLGIIVQTEVPCVNIMKSTMPSDYYTHLMGQYEDMVIQHYNHPSIIFWGLSNETTTDDKSFAHDKIESYITRIRQLDSSRMVGYVMAAGTEDPSGYYNNPSADWFGANIYEGWYSNQNSNNPTARLTPRIRNTITNKGKALAYSEYGCGGTQHCHSDDFMTTTTRGNYARHDIEYMMWLHEGHIAAIKNYPELLFTAQWQLFDIAVANRNEGYTVCLDGENTSIDDNLRRLNNKGLVERDHITKKDTFYLYKALWNPSPFVHICGKDYTKTSQRVIKCYSNDGNSLELFVNGVSKGTVSLTDHIAEFTADDYNSGDVIRVDGATSSDTFTF